MANDVNQPNNDNSPGQNGDNTEIAAPPPASRDADTEDNPPPLSISGKGPMDQSVPDVASGSTPVTRHDD